MEHKTWHQRGYLPHFDRPGLIQGVTFRLHDAVPKQLLQRWKTELSIGEGSEADEASLGELRRRIARCEDQGLGACWLRRPGIAELVESALMHFDGTRYRLLAWCVMPNHVHALLETYAGNPVGSVVGTWKSFTARRANEILGRKGPFWQRDYYDRYIRDAEHYSAALRYIENNPVKAGLVSRPEEWPWSSAAKRQKPTT